MSPSEPPTAATFGAATVNLGQPPALVAAISGDLDIANAELVGRFIADGCRRRLQRLEIDLTATSYMDSAGIAMLVDIADRLDTMRTPIHVVAPPGTIAHRVIELTGLSNRLHRVNTALGL